MDSWKHSPIAHLMAQVQYILLNKLIFAMLTPRFVSLSHLNLTNCEHALYLPQDSLLLKG